MKNSFKIIVLIYFFCINFSMLAQELPPIIKFTPENYKGENQNWMISQASNKYIYVANSGGLLEFNGAEWKMHLSPNKTIIRAVNVVNERIYIGCFREFGYYERDTIGKLQYHSLAQKLKNRSIDNENIWNIHTYQEWVLFQSQARIYFYNTLTKSFKIINSKNTITKLFIVKNTIYYHVTNEGLYRIEGGISKLISNNPTLKTVRVVNIFNLNNQLLIQTHKSGFYLLNNSKLSIWKTPANDYIKSMSVFNSIQLEDGSIVLGTISNGIVYISIEGKVHFQINQKNGLSNNTALSLYEDIDKNVWVGLDNGINCINIKSPIKIFNDDEGILGTVYASTIFNNYLYLGTNQGLFYKNLENKQNDFQFIKGTAGQVWSLYIYNNKELFCAHHNGTFSIDKDKATQIAAISGTWNLRTIPKKTNTLLQGNYDGLYILQKEKGSWKLKNKVKGFDNSARYFEINNDNQVWISHGYKGVYKLTLNKELTIAKNVSLEPELSIGKNSSLIYYKNKLLYSYEKGIYSYDPINKVFSFDSIFSPLIEKEKYLSGKLVDDQKGKLWAFSKDNISYITTDNLTNTPKISQIPIPSHLRKGMVGYENISLIENDEYLIGTANGYIKIDLSKINYNNKYSTLLNTANLKKIGSNKKEFNHLAFREFDYKPGIITFHYSVPKYDKYLTVKYQYRLEGRYNEWTSWSTNSKASFDNLSYGEYTFKVRAKIGNKLSNNNAIYKFRVNKPWYFSISAIIGYLILFVLITLLIHRAYKKYYNKQHKLKQLANEELIVRIKNEKLKQDIEGKNRELAISTMSIIKKNEVLSSIKKELKNTSNDANVSPIIKLIDKNLNNNKDWQFFEEAFNNADQHFLEKIKKVHPNLTPNDLRFCAYLRLNLSSKEIAPLLNISVRSIEIKRYRLRKKMNLTHSESLVNHILDI